jgi:fatty-acyl-CoA synthase
MTFTRHFAHWPPGAPKTLDVSRDSVYSNLAASAAKHPERTLLDYYGTRLTYAHIKREADALAGFLQQRCGVAKGDRVLLYLQNSPQFVIAYYAILRADAAVVPVNPMNRTEELRHYVEDAQARVAIVGQELYERIAPLGLPYVIVVTYSDYLRTKTDLPLPDFVRAPRVATAGIAWRDAIDAGLVPAAHTAGMQAGMNAPIYRGSTIVLLSRWDRDCAAMQIARARVTNWSAITTMLVDFISNPRLAQHDISSLRVLGGGGAAMPEALARKLEEVFRQPYVEGYGLTETMAPSHINPPQRPKRQCAGIPFFNTDARVLDLETKAELGPGQVGEIIVHGPQVFKGYWRQEQATRDAFTEHDGKRFFRTGDLGYYDEEGYFFITDRLKRMINASGYKVWPAEVEAMLYAHPGIKEACVIGAPDGYRGETVKALIVPREAGLTAEQVIDWARERMAAFKVPRLVQFVAELPKTATGKILWRELQEKERAR